MRYVAIIIVRIRWQLSWDRVGFYPQSLAVGLWLNDRTKVEWKYHFSCARDLRAGKDDSTPHLLRSLGYSEWDPVDLVTFSLRLPSHSSAMFSNGPSHLMCTGAACGMNWFMCVHGYCFRNVSRISLHMSIACNSDSSGSTKVSVGFFLLCT